MEMSNVSAKSFAVLTVLYNGIKKDDTIKKELKIPEIIEIVKSRYKIEDISQSYVYSLFIKLESERIISKTKYNKGYDIRYKLTGIGTDYYKNLNKLFLNISKTKIDILIEIIKERPLNEQETVMLEIADKLTKCTDTRYSINKQKK